MACSPPFYAGCQMYDGTVMEAVNSTQSCYNTHQWNDVPRHSGSFAVQSNTDYQYLQHNYMTGNILERVSSQDCHNQTLTTPSNSCSSRAITNSRVLSNSAQHSSEASPRSRSHQLVTIERYIDDCIYMFSRMKVKICTATGNSNIRKHNQEEYNNGIGRAASVPTLATEYSNPDMVHDLAMLKGCTKALENEFKSILVLKSSDDYTSDDESVPDVEISERHIELNITCKNDTPSASCRNSHTQPQTRLNKVGRVSIAPVITTINFDVGSAQVETIHDKIILQAAENILLAKIDWSKDTQMEALQAEKRKLERKMEKIACKKKLVEERIKEEHKMVERFVLRLEDRDHTLEDILDQIKEGVLPNVAKCLLRDFNVRLLALDCGLNFLLETTTGEDYQSKLHEVVHILGYLLPARKRNDAVWDDKGCWNYDLNPIPDLGMKSPLLENYFYQVSGENDDYDEESQERLQREFYRNAFQSEKRLSETRSEGSLEVLRSRRINSTPATQGRVSDGCMPLQVDPFASYTFNRGEEMRQGKRSLSAPNITVEIDDGVSVHSVFIGDTSYSQVSINSGDDNAWLPGRKSSGRGLHIKIRDKEARRSISDYPEEASEYYAYLNNRERKRVYEDIQDREGSRSISHYPEEGSEFYEFLRYREKKRDLEKIKDGEGSRSIFDLFDSPTWVNDEYLKLRKKKSVWKKIKGAFKRRK